MDSEAKIFSEYLCELTLVDTKMLKWRPSLQAGASIYLAKKILKRDEPWSKTQAKHSGYSENKVRECAREICKVLTDAPNKPNYASIYKKYSTSRYSRVALIPERTRRANQADNSSYTVTESATSSMKAATEPDAR
jgi:G2/mitotic-specific cyclin 1/2